MIEWDSEDAIRIRAGYHHAMMRRGFDLMECLSVEAAAEKYREDAAAAESIIDVHPASLPATPRLVPADPVQRERLRLHEHLIDVYGKASDE